MDYNKPPRRVWKLVCGRRAKIREFIKIVLLALVICFAINVTIASYVINGPCMEPNLYDGQRILVNKVAYLLHPPQRGDVIVFHSTVNPGEDWIKRVIAIPGDTVEIKDGLVYINGIPIEEPYVTQPWNDTYPPTEIGENEYFVLGDNRNSSIDSRYGWMVPRENIIGKAWIRYWPITEWGLVPNYLLAVD